MMRVSETGTAEKQKKKKFVNSLTNYLVMSLFPVVDQLVEYQTYVYSCSAAMCLVEIADGRKALDEGHVVASLEYAAGYQVDAGRERLVYAVTLTER